MMRDVLVVVLQPLVSMLAGVWLTQVVVMIDGSKPIFRRVPLGVLLAVPFLVGTSATFALVLSLCRV